MIADYYYGVGAANELLAHSEYHQNIETGQYLEIEVVPPLWCNQARFYLNDDIPTATITWAWLSENAQTDIHAASRAFAESEWNCEVRFFFNDWISPYDDIRVVLIDIPHNDVPNEIATSLCRIPDGTVRPINRWTGINLRKSQNKNTASELIEDVQSGKKVCSLPKPKRQAHQLDLENPADVNTATTRGILQ
ncbi:toxin-activating lysine-acyltransferase [uncultured Ruegeria sp.]|uniref:toxin-activating lysine-acyltransferase n=1 Tax=uncultured Ruegeria sp. TaxID=259304 RepID=UPI002623AD55|nr:toxin-activating lysine-acyltransferase [uncultured Ruegeria sp.]